MLSGVWSLAGAKSLETRQRPWFPKGVPVINHRKAAILEMGSLKPWPVVVDGDRRPPAGTLTCAFDHRIANGAKVAQLLGSSANSSSHRRHRSTYLREGRRRPRTPTRVATTRTTVRAGPLSRARQTPARRGCR